MTVRYGNTSPGGFGGYPGYRDPLSHGRGFGGGQGSGFGSMPALPSTPGIGMALSQSGGGGGGGVVDTAGRYVKGALDWLTDEEQGAGRLNAIGNAVGTVAGVYGAHKDRQMWQEEMERREREAAEEKERRAGYGPLMGTVLERMFSSASGGGG